MNCTAVSTIGSKRVLVVSVFQPENEFTQLGAFCVELRIPKRVVPEELARQRMLPFEDVPVHPGSWQLHRVDLHGGHDPRILSLWRFKAPNLTAVLAGGPLGAV